MSVVVGKKNINSWNPLCNILGNFGGVESKNKLKLHWESPEDDQFDFLLKMMSQLTNINLQGTYHNHSKEWIISS